MGPTMRSLVLAELSKLRSLPEAAIAAVATVLLGSTIAAALAANDRNAYAGPVDAVLASVPFVQLGIILLGILSAAHEYAGGQIHTSLAAAPNRMRFLAAKSAAVALVVSFVSTLTVGAGLMVAAITRPSQSAMAASGGAVPSMLVGAVLYLALIGLLAFAVAILVRHLAPALVVMLVLVLIASPLVGAASEHARWLPDRAGGLLYLPDTDAVLSVATGAAVLLGWVVATWAAAAATFAARDA